MAVVKSGESCNKCVAPRCHSCTIDDCDEACTASESGFDTAICEACRLRTDAATPHYEIPILVRCKCLTIKPGEECPYYIPDTEDLHDAN